MRVLLTGSSGWLGRFLAPLLRAEGHEVTGTLNLLEAAVAAGNDRFVSTSTTSVMISQAIRVEAGDAAVWLVSNFTRGFADALRVGAPLPFAHDADYVSPQELARQMG